MKAKDRESIRMMFGGKCAYCGCELEKGWCADHVLPVGRRSEFVMDGSVIVGMKHNGEMDHPERDHLGNLFPSCRVCNYAKSNGDIEYLRRFVAAQVERTRRESWNFRMAEKYGLVQVTEKPIMFWFETFVYTQRVMV